VPFRYATALYMLNWVTFDIIGVVLPYLLVYWVAGGDLLAKVPGLGLPIESAVVGLMMLTATLFLPFWNWLPIVWRSASPTSSRWRSGPRCCCSSPGCRN
jgi:hypothetical protein